MQKIRIHLLAVGFYGLLAFIILNPIILHTGSMVAGFDYFNFHWNFWWMRHALTTPGLNVYETNFTFFPFMNNLGYHTLTETWFPIWALLEPLVGTLVAMTFIIVVSTILNGYMMFLLLKRMGIAVSLALLGGMALQCTPLVRYFYYNTHINLMAWFWLPTHLLLWQQIVAVAKKHRWRLLVLWAFVGGLSLYALALTDHQLLVFTAFVLVPYGLLTLRRSPQRVVLVGVGLAIVSISSILLWVAGPLPYILEFSGTLAPGPAEGRPGVPFPRGYFSVDAVWWKWNTPTLGGFAMITMLLSVLVGLLPVRKYLPRDRCFWFVVLLPPLLLSMGPDIVLFGQTIPMPYRILHALTNGMLRMPWRLAPIYVIVAMIFVGITWTPLIRRWRWRQVYVFAPLFLLLTIDARIWQAGPLRPVLPTYEFYETIGMETGEPYDDLVVLEVPTGVGTGEVLIGDERAITLQMYTMTHHKRTVNGFISRAPTEHFWYLNTDDPMLSWLGQRRLLDAEKVESQLRERIFDWPIGYIVVHQDIIGRNTSTVQEIIGFLNSLEDLLCPVWVEGDVVVYRTAAHPDGCPGRVPPEITPGVYEIDIGTPGDERYIGGGWHWPESIFNVTLRWTGAKPEALTYVDLLPGDYQVTITAQAFWEARELQVMVNGTSLGEPVTIETNHLQHVTFDLPAEVVGDGKHLILTLDYDAALVPVSVGQSADERSLAVAVDRFRFERQP